MPLHNSVRELLKIRVVPQINESAWAEVAFEDTGHVYVEQRLRRIVNDALDGIRDVLSDTMKGLDR